MAFFISPGVQVREFDISTIVSLYANSAAAYVGSFEWGPVEDVITISSKARLQKYFGNPTDDNAQHWFSCSNFLDYANNLKVVRVVDEDTARNATISGGEAQKALDEIKRISNYNIVMSQIEDLTNNVNSYAHAITKIEEKLNKLTDPVIAKYEEVLNGSTDPNNPNFNKGLYKERTAKEADKKGIESKPDGVALSTYTLESNDYENYGFAQLNYIQKLYSEKAKEIEDTLKEQENIIKDNEYKILTLLASDPQYDNKKLTYENAIKAANQAIATAKDEKSYNDARMNAIKPHIKTCNIKLQKVTDELNNINANIANYEKLLAEANEEKSQYELDKSKYESLKTASETDIDVLQGQIDQFQQQIADAEAAIKASTVYIKNQTVWTKEYSPGNDRKFGEFAAKYPSTLGSNIGIYMADAETYTGVTSVTTNVDSYVYTLDDNFKPVKFSFPPTGMNDVAQAQIIIDQENPEYDANGYMTGYYKIKEIEIIKPGKNYRVAPDVTLPTPEHPKNVKIPRDGVPKGYASLWKYANQFLSPPNTTNYTKQRGGENDELHIVIVDETGVMTGVKGQVMERFANVSKAEDARYDDGAPAYYAYVLRDQSQYVYWMDHPMGMTNWGLPALNTNFKCLASSYEGHLGGGYSGSAREEIGNAELMRGWDCFADTERVDVGILITGPADRVLQQYVINIAEKRMDCVAVISPEMDDVVSKPGNELNNIIKWRNTLTASSYGFADCNWKYQYDQYNDTYRWIPCNPDIAGLMARTDEDHDPWWSPAGFNRGHIKNVVKLAWNPDKTDRDEMYAVSVNPVCLFLNEGTILYGDKTMLMKQSAFSRINVRRLFIVLEKSIATAAKYMLFEFNDDFTRLRFRQMVEPFLRDVKGKRGMYDYRVVCDASNNTPQVIDANAFVGDIYIKPTRTINFIQLNFVAVATGVAFDEVVGSFGDF